MLANARTSQPENAVGHNPSIATSSPAVLLTVNWSVRSRFGFGVRETLVRRRPPCPGFSGERNSQEQVAECHVRKQVQFRTIGASSSDEPLIRPSNGSAFDQQ